MGSLLGSKPNRTAVLPPASNPFHLIPFISRVFVRFPCSCIFGSTFFFASRLLLIYLSSFITTRSVTMAGLKERMKEGKKACVPSEKRRPKIVAVRLRCNIASSCHILLPFRLNSRRCRPEDKDDVDDVDVEDTNEGASEGNGKGRERTRSQRSVLPLVGFDTSNNLLGFRLKSYR